MPPKHEIAISSGTIYIGDDGKWIPLYGVEDASIEEIDYADQRPKENPFLKLNESFGEIAGTAKIATEAWMNLVGVTKEFILSLCSNRRLVHLAKHAKHMRTRKKNFNRIKRDLEKAERKFNRKDMTTNV